MRLQGDLQSFIFQTLESRRGEAGLDVELSLKGGAERHLVVDSGSEEAPPLCLKRKKNGDFLGNTI